ncbi:MAG: PEP-CTERM sorting domain-containing protein [Proteobacteria bacterium]|nr:PEP-CTERM sorting domain-containing protein [Pseudomonadota bacterium]
MRYARSAAAAALLLAVAAQPARAVVLIANSSSGCGGCDTVHLVDNVLNDNEVNGWLASSPGIDVLFTTTSGPIGITGGQGQAWVGGTDGSTENLTFSLVGGHTFDAAEFNLNTTNGTPSPWYVTITGVDQNNTAYSQNFAFDTHGDMGNQFFDLSILAGSGEHISSISFVITDSTFDTALNPSPIIAAGQWRVGGLDGGPIPEPTAWGLMILGFGGAGAVLRRRRGLAAA